MAKKKEQQSLIPELRFPEFEGEWEEKVLKSVCDMKAGKFVKAAEINESPNINLYPCYGGNGLRGYTATFTHDGKHPLIGRQGAHCGNIKLIEGKFHATEHAVVVDPKDKHSKDWLFYALILLNLNQLATGQAQPGLSVTVLALVSIKTPPPIEQQKIADCLSSLDDLITAHSTKLNALQDHKKGLLQQLFPKEGQTTPTLRFPGFRKKWKTDTLENLCTAKISYGIVQAGPHIPNGMPYIKSTNLNARICLSHLERTSDVIAKKYRRSEVVPGDLVFSLRGNIGVAQILPKNIPVANLTQGTARLRTKGPPQFYIQALQSRRIHNRILAVSKGSTFQEISLEDLRKIKLLHPEEAEQNKIADYLSNLDTLITAQTQAIDSLKLHKKGLMQQLFPNPELSKA